MGLTNKQFETIMYGYDTIKNQNRDLLAARKKELQEKLPSYFTLEGKINAVRLERAKAGIANNEAAALQCQKDEQALKEQRDRLLSDNGYPLDYLSVQYRCPICKDSGFLPDTRQKCKCFITAQTKLLFEQSGISDLIKTQNFDTLNYDYFDEEEKASYEKAVTAAKEFVSNFQSDYRNLLFCGSVGTGKTFLSCCIAKALMEQGFSVTYCSSDKLFRDLSDLRFQEDKDLYFSFMENIYERDLLIIDDLGTESITERAKSDLFTCLNNRDIAQKSTIISTNFYIEDLNNNYDERIFSRISSRFQVHVFEGQDIRIKKKLQDKQS